MDFRNSRAAHHSVEIICKGTVQFPFVSHLSAALRREGISSFPYIPETNLLGYPGGQHPLISVVVFSNMVEANDPWSHIAIKVMTNRMPLRRGNVVTYVVDPRHYYGDSILEAGIIVTRHRSRISSSRILTDSELVEEIVKDVYGRIYSAERVGIYSKLLEIDSLLYKQPHDVRSIGIWGLPGIGKTTLAKAVFN